MKIFEDLVRKLAVAKIENPRLESRLLMASVINSEPSEIYSATEVSDDEAQKIKNLLEKRLQHYPLDKILGHREFYKADFITNEDVLSPRPDTEILVEEALKYIPTDKKVQILDMGIGSGCIILSLLLERKLAQGTGIDISEKALAVAWQNAENLQIANRIKFVNADWFKDNLSRKLGQKFDFIVTNPPYIPSRDIENLDIEVKNHDPLVALDGGTDGYDSYKKIAEVAYKLINDNGYIFIEAGIGQAENIKNIFLQKGWKFVKIVADLAEIKRCVIMQK